MLLFVAIAALAAAFWRHILAIGAFCFVVYLIGMAVTAPFRGHHEERLQVTNMRIESVDGFKTLYFTATNVTEDRLIYNLRFECGLATSMPLARSLKPGQTAEGAVLFPQMNSQTTGSGSDCKKLFSAVEVM